MFIDMNIGSTDNQSQLFLYHLPDTVVSGITLCVHAVVQSYNPTLLFISSISFPVHRKRLLYNPIHL